MAFQPGDVVCLKSGGAVMTVEKIATPAGTSREAVFCNWFEKNKPQRGHFAPEALEIYVEPGPIVPFIA
ncbi:MAG: DUF2158 domain-containing protein [Xanthobacteraceae bacterium]|nr:DUF2158 domain-containing protein [Xanthobacteraceae bacterium]